MARGDHLVGSRKETGNLTSGTVELSNGTPVTFRAVSPDDAQALQGLHARCSGRSIELRFLGPKGELSDEKAGILARAEDEDRLALAALAPGRPGEIVTVVRFEREGGGDEAEYAALSRTTGRG